MSESDRHDQIMDAAGTVFRDVGYNGATMVRIAVAAGVSYGDLLDEFPDKSAMLLELLSRRDDDDDAMTNLDSITDPDAALEAIVDLVRLNSQRRGMIELFTVLVGESVSPNNPSHTFFQQRYQRRLASLQRAYERGRAAGMLRPDRDPADAAAELVALMDGLQIQWLLSDGELDMPAVIRQHLARQIVPAEERAAR